MSRPLLSRLQSWHRQESKLLLILSEALRCLITKNSHANSKEDDINYELFQEIRKQVFLLKFPFSIIFDSPNQPRLDEERDRNREKKRPDIQFLWTNKQANTPAEYHREYVVECKRLRNPLNGRRFNEKYVTEGVMRFISSDHGYAKGSLSGTMIGYVQNMPLQEIVNDVNVALAKNTCSALSTVSLVERGVSAHRHNVNRPAAANLELNHLWADMRPTVSAIVP